MYEYSYWQYWLIPIIMRPTQLGNAGALTRLALGESLVPEAQTNGP